MFLYKSLITSLVRMLHSCGISSAVLSVADSCYWYYDMSHLGERHRVCVVPAHIRVATPVLLTSGVYVGLTSVFPCPPPSPFLCAPLSSRPRPAVVCPGFSTAPAPSIYSDPGPTRSVPSPEALFALRPYGPMGWSRRPPV